MPLTLPVFVTPNSIYNRSFSITFFSFATHNQQQQPPAAIHSKIKKNLLKRIPPSIIPCFYVSSSIVDLSSRVVSLLSWFICCLQKNFNPPLREVEIFNRCWKHKHMKCCWFSSFVCRIFHFIRHKVSLLHFLMTHFLRFSLASWKRQETDFARLCPLFKREFHSRNSFHFARN